MWRRGIRLTIADGLGIILLVSSVLTGLILLNALATQWDILADGSVMAWSVGMGWCRGTFLLLLVTSAVFAAARFRERRVAAAIPLLFNIGVFLVATYYPFTSKWIDARFEQNRSEYNAVVRLVEDGALSPQPNSDTITLPEHLAHLSAGGGEILVDTSGGQTRVFFFTFRGILDNFSGFMYRSDNSPPQGDGFLGDWEEVRPMRAHWYFCASW